LRLHVTPTPVYAISFALHFLTLPRLLSIVAGLDVYAHAPFAVRTAHAAAFCGCLPAAYAYGSATRSFYCAVPRVNAALPDQINILDSATAFYRATITPGSDRITVTVPDTAIRANAFFAFPLRTAVRHTLLDCRTRVFLLRHFSVPFCHTHTLRLYTPPLHLQFSQVYARYLDAVYATNAHAPRTILRARVLRTRTARFRVAFAFNRCDCTRILLLMIVTHACRSRCAFESFDRCRTAHCAAAF